MYFTVPSGAPDIVEAYSHTSTTISLRWLPPAKSDINGELSGFVVSYGVDDTMKQIITEENKEARVCY